MKTNEKRDNFIRGRFDLENWSTSYPSRFKTVLMFKECHIPFEFASSQKVVVKIPQPPRTRMMLGIEFTLLRQSVIQELILYDFRTFGFTGHTAMCVFHISVHLEDPISVELKALDSITYWISCQLQKKICPLVKTLIIFQYHNAARPLPRKYRIVLPPVYYSQLILTSPERLFKMVHVLVLS
ncbi:hypothetical protein Ocin01_19411 [Orchesella cincta]|uniref:Uncharacterized protein n=1 Tax=Orchesella cincta TaxID=48709 RepID=A0A1D2M2Y0_ORCCI|nr:hypothetical protein Ocin01_19411 [Orchesella cincta]